MATKITKKQMTTESAKLKAFAAKLNKIAAAMEEQELKSFKATNTYDYNMAENAIYGRWMDAAQLAEELAQLSKIHYQMYIDLLDK